MFNFFYKIVFYFFDVNFRILFLIGSKIPDIPIKFINFLKNQWFPGRTIRHSLLEIVSKGKIDYKIDFSQGLKTYERNLQNIINLCLRNNIEVVL